MVSSLTGKRWGWQGSALPAPATPVEWLKEAGLWTQGSKTTSWHMGLWW
jgi:hypothetical protein